ncbi:MAG: hypothetical protein R6U29_07595, partial [Desulfosudaceae bacterium]
MDVSRWTRLEHDCTPVYVRPDIPDWFVPNAAGDDLLLTLTEKGAAADDDLTVDQWPVRRFLSVLASPPAEPYAGRGECLDLTGLEECWLHVTDRCNLACRHCLFACSSKKRLTMSRNPLPATSTQSDLPAPATAQPIAWRRSGITRTRSGRAMPAWISR